MTFWKRGNYRESKRALIGNGLGGSREVDIGETWDIAGH